MSATKNYHQEFFEQEHNDFVTDDTYQDFLRMQREHQEQTELVEINEELAEQHEGAKLNRNTNWKMRENSFFAKNTCSCGGLDEYCKNCGAKINSNSDLPF